MDTVGEARIWAYSRALGKALIKIAPEDFRMENIYFGQNGRFKVSCTIRTQQEAEAVCEIIMQLARKGLTSYREAVRGDIYLTAPKPSFREELERMFGPTIAIEARDPL